MAVMWICVTLWPDDTFLNVTENVEVDVCGRCSGLPKKKKELHFQLHLFKLKEITTLSDLNLTSLNPAESESNTYPRVMIQSHQP